MALNTVLKKIEKAKAAYEDQLANISGELADEIVKHLAKEIPAGWQLYWTQSDEMYNDEDYYFGINGPHLVSEREPRQGRETKAEVTPLTEKRRDPYRYQREYDHVVTYGSPAEYEWILDEDCPLRTETPDLWGTPGVINFDDYDEEFACGVTEETIENIQAVFNNIGKDTIRQAFGDQSEVTIQTNGTYNVT